MTHLRERALENRLLRRTFLSDDGSTLAVFVRLAPYIQTEKQKRPVVRAVTSLAPSVVGGRFPVSFTGFPVIQEEYTNKGLGEAWRFFIVSAMILCVFLYFTFRSSLGLYVPQFTVITSVLLLLALMSLCGQEIDLISNIIPSLLLVYGIADSIHLIHRYYEELGQGLSRREALIVVIRRMGVACFMTSFTTAVGFFSLTTATIRIIKNFGLFAGTGIFFAYLATIVLIPILLSFHPSPTHRMRKNTGEGVIEKALALVGRANERFPKTLIVLGLLLFAGSGLLCLRVDMESFILEELAEDNPIVRANHILDREMAGIFPYQVQIASGEEGGALEPDFLRRVDRLESFIGSQPWIRKTFSIVTLLKEMNQAMHEGDPAYYRVPETRQLVAQYLLLYNLSGDPEDLDVLLTPDGSYVRLACQGIDMGTSSFFELKRRTEEKAATLFDPPASYHVTGRSLLANRALDNIVRDMFVSFLSAFGIIFLAVTILYRSVKAGLITMLPNIIPLVVTLGFMGIFGITLRVSTVVAFAICLGMAVDDTIHYLTRFREELDRTGDYVESMYTTLQTAGRAIVLTTGMLISGFLVFLSSSFKATHDFGLLASVALTSSLLGSLVFLPAALNTLKPWRVEDRQRNERVF
jgi:predicted RND superfamily exporter protein